MKNNFHKTKYIEEKNMFGYYTDKRLSDSERKILKCNPDDYNWHMIIHNAIFNQQGLFEIRDDIKIPNDKDGTVVIFEKGNVVYYKTQNHKALSDDIKKIKESCSYLADLFEDHIDAYIAHTGNCKIDRVEECDDINCTLHFKSFCENNGEEILAELENKLINKEPFTITDSVNHILLPFIGDIDQDSFNKKYHHYMEIIES